MTDRDANEMSEAEERTDDFDLAETVIKHPTAWPEECRQLARALLKERERAELWMALADEFVNHKTCWESSRSCTSIHRDAFRAALDEEEKG